LKILKNWIAVIIAIVIAYQIATLGPQGLWSDEIFAVMVTRPELSLTEILQRYLKPEDTPPLHYILMHFWQLVAPGGDWFMRVPGLYFYVLTIAAAAMYPCRAMDMARRITFIPLMGCSFGTIYFAQEVRSYELFGLLAICILYDMLDFGIVLDGGREPSWIRVGWSATVGLAASYTHVFGFLFFGAAIIALIGYGVGRGRIPWRVILLGSVVVGGLTPWMVIRFGFPWIRGLLIDRSEYFAGSFAISQEVRLLRH
jgi:uncharacterized membrane protein